jgi:cytochrome c oxidase assembly protein subunit 15
VLEQLLHRVRSDRRLLTRLCLASLVANTVIVVTGATVRLTGSGLGCPTWPRCTSDSLVNTPQYGVNGYIEFGNRLLTPLISLIAVACVVVVLLARPRRRSLLLPAVGVLVGVGAQALIGGFTVRLHLQPWAVAVHFLVSMGLMYATYALWRRSAEGDGAPEWQVGRDVRTLVRGIVWTAGVVLVVGTVVTGAGPHAGDEAAARNGFDPATVSQLHADVVVLLLGLTVGGWIALRAVGAPRAVSRAAVALLVVELAQGVVGAVQYAAHLPALLVAVHVAGSCGVWLAACVLLFGLRVRPVAAEPATRPAPAGRESAPIEFTPAGGRSAAAG